MAGARQEMSLDSAVQRRCGPQKEKPDDGSSCHCDRGADVNAKVEDGEEPLPEQGLLWHLKKEKKRINKSRSRSSNRSRGRERERDKNENK